MKATYFLGICYENGWGIQMNEAMAATLYETAAAAGHADAQYNLGVFYETGRGGKTQLQSSKKGWKKLNLSLELQFLKFSLNFLIAF